MRYILKELKDLHHAYCLEAMEHIGYLSRELTGKYLVDTIDEGFVRVKTKDGWVDVTPSHDLYLQIKKKHINIFYESEFHKIDDPKHINKNVKVQLIWDGSQEQLDVLRGVLEDKLNENFTFKLSLTPEAKRVDVILYSVTKAREVSKGSIVTVFKDNEVKIN